MSKKTVITLFLIALLAAVKPPKAGALDFWQYPEMAERHAFFISCFAAQFTFADYFALYHPEIIFDYLLPFGLPVSLGASIRAFDPELASYGLRIGYHINVDDENTDVYVLYNTAIVFSGKYIWLEFGGRIGFRRRFGSFLCFTVETGFLLQNIFFGLSVKCN